MTKCPTPEREGKRFDVGAARQLSNDARDEFRSEAHLARTLRAALDEIERLKCIIEGSTKGRRTQTAEVKRLRTILKRINEFVIQTDSSNEVDNA